jgi:hypothetical protein
MKTMRNFVSRKELMRTTLVVALLLVSVVMFADPSGGTHPGFDPEPGGMSVPIDGGILMAILAGGSLVTMLFKKKKKEE